METGARCRGGLGITPVQVDPGETLATPRDEGEGLGAEGKAGYKDALRAARAVSPDARGRAGGSGASTPAHAGGRGHQARAGGSALGNSGCCPIKLCSIGVGVAAAAALRPEFLPLHPRPGTLSPERTP